LKFEAIPAVMMFMVIFLFVTPCGLACGHQHLEEHTAFIFSLDGFSEDGGNMFLQNLNTHLQVQTASQDHHRKLQGYTVADEMRRLL
jgi:hypothetical protein